MCVGVLYNLRRVSGVSGLRSLQTLVFYHSHFALLSWFPEVSTPPNLRKPQPQVLRTEQITKIRVIQLKIASLIRFTKKHEACVEESLIFVVYHPPNFHKLTSPRNRTATYAIHALA